MMHKVSEDLFDTSLDYYFCKLNIMIVCVDYRM